MPAMIDNCLPLAGIFIYYNKEREVEKALFFSVYRNYF